MNPEDVDDATNFHQEEAIVTCGTTKGQIVMKFYRQWSPNGYDRAIYLFEQGFFDASHFYRVVPNFLVQFGISYSEDPQLKAMSRVNIPDDPQWEPPIPFAPGIISYAGSGPNSRTSQMFIAYRAASSLGTQLWETPVGEIERGMDVVESFYSYGDMPPWGKGPEQGPIHKGPSYIEENFPKTDRFTTCQVERLSEAEQDLLDAPDPNAADDDKILEKETEYEKDSGEQLKDEDDGEEVPPVVPASLESRLRRAEAVKLPAGAKAMTNDEILSASAAVVFVLLVLALWWRWIVGKSAQKATKSV